MARNWRNTNIDDPGWSGFRSSMHDLDRSLRDIDDRFDNMYTQFHQVAPGSISQSNRRSFDSGFPDTTIDSPITMDRNGRQLARYCFDVRHFRPEEISIKSFDDKRVEVYAKHQEKDGNHSVFREYRRTCVMPDEVDMNTIRSNLNPDGSLEIEAPLPAIEAPGSGTSNSKSREPIPMQIKHHSSRNDRERSPQRN